MSEEEKLEKIESFVKNFRSYYINALYQYADQDYCWAHEGELLCNMILDEIEQVKYDETSH